MALNEHKQADRAGNDCGALTETSAKQAAPKWWLAVQDKIKFLVKKSVEAVSVICTVTGKAVYENVSILKDGGSTCAHHGAELLSNTVGVGIKRCGHFLAAQAKRIAVPFFKMARAPRLVATAIRSDGMIAGASIFCKGVWRNRGFFTTIANYALPVLGFCFLFQVVSSGMNITYALAIEENGKLIGYVEDEAVFTEAQLQVRARIVNTDAEQTAEFELAPSYSVVAVNPDDIVDVDTITNSIIRMSSSDILTAKGVYIDGEFYGAVTSADNIKSIIEQTLSAYRTGAEGEQVSLTRDIELREGLYLTSSVVDSEKIEQLLQSNVSARQVYVIEKGDSPIMIANKNGLTYAEFKKLNPTIEEECFVGQEALISNEEPFLSVRVQRTETYDEEIPYETEVTKDNTKNKSYSLVTQQGKNGLQTVTASVEYVNGIEQKRDILETTVLEEPVTKKMVQGTITETTYRASYVAATYGSGSIDSNFIWPVGGSGGYISQYYGNYGHTGLDIAGSYGLPILAVAPGKVVVSGWYYSYGKCVVIDHGNGVRTLYGHASSLNVSVGDYVSQGQTIALMGSTGNSSGNHLHIEVQINGSTRNPLNYIG